jgi:hypothetical protein
MNSIGRPIKFDLDPKDIQFIKGDLIKVKP